jgi:YfiH family protein
LSLPPWDSFNLADHVGDDPESVLQNRERLKKELSLPGEPLWLRQVHGCDVASFEENRPEPECDASVSHRAGEICAVLTADCLPLLLCNAQGDAVAAVHAGWRGLASGVIEQAVAKMACPVDKLLAWLGPAIGPDAFEVGADVRERFLSHAEEAEEAFKPLQRNKWMCDIYRLATQRLMHLGVREISGGSYCTFSDREKFYSYRRDGVTGRMASLIWFEPK